MAQLAPLQDQPALSDVLRPLTWKESLIQGVCRQGRGGSWGIARISAVCWSTASRACEQLRRTGPNHSPTATAIANQAARPIGSHHHAFISAALQRRYMGRWASIACGHGTGSLSNAAEPAIC